VETWLDKSHVVPWKVNRQHLGITICSCPKMDNYFSPRLRQGSSRRDVVGHLWMIIVPVRAGSNGLTVALDWANHCQHSSCSLSHLVYDTTKRTPDSVPTRRSISKLTLSPFTGKRVSKTRPTRVKFFRRVTRSSRDSLRVGTVTDHTIYPPVHRHTCSPILQVLTQPPKRIALHATAILSHSPASHTRHAGR
jgi:hypothetical protein